jgi:hypothetical protein
MKKYYKRCRHRVFWFFSFVFPRHTDPYGAGAMVVVILGHRWYWDAVDFGW